MTHEEPSAGTCIKARTEVRATVEGIDAGITQRLNPRPQDLSIHCINKLSDRDIYFVGLFRSPIPPQGAQSAPYPHAAPLRVSEQRVASLPSQKPRHSAAYFLRHSHPDAKPATISPLRIRMITWLDLSMARMIMQWQYCTMVCYNISTTGQRRHNAGVKLTTLPSSNQVCSNRVQVIITLCPHEEISMEIRSKHPSALYFARPSVVLSQLSC